MRLFCFHPEGHGPVSFFVMAPSKAEAIASVLKFIQEEGIDSYQSNGFPNNHLVKELGPLEWTRTTTTKTTPRLHTRTRGLLFHMNILPPHHDYHIEPIDGDFKKKLANYKATVAWEASVRSITERDRCCRKCGYHGPKKEVHHIRYRAITNCTDDDLILLCTSCHNLWHKDRTPVSWKDWISIKLPTPWNGIRQKHKGKSKEQRLRYRLKYPEKTKENQIKHIVQKQKLRIMSQLSTELKELALSKGLDWPTQAWARKQLASQKKQ